ncbi:MAG: DNA repair protein RadC [Oscillospiraceae bacterium]
MAENNINLHTGHRVRLKTRFKEEGLKNFDDHNVLELLLFYALPQVDTNDIAHSLIDEFGSLSGVFEASVDSLKNVKGIGENAALLIKLIPEVFSRYEKDKLKKETDVLNSVESAGRFFISYFRGITNEHFVAVCLDNKGRVKKTFSVSEGSINSTDVNIRKIAGTVINTNSSAIIVAHNHPAGVAAPSLGDVEATRNLVMTLKKLDIQVNDHFIIAGSDYFSMAHSNKFRELFSKMR